jgi:hypothetical protein
MFFSDHVTFHLRAQAVKGGPQRRQTRRLPFGRLNLVEQMGDQGKILASPPAVLPH